MSGYGFRLYKVQLVRSLTATKKEPFHACGASRDDHVGVWVERLFSHLEQYDTLTRMPQLRVAEGDPYPEIASHVSADPDRDDPQIRFLSHSVDKSMSQYLFTISYGTAGRFPFAMATERSKDVRLTAMSTAQDYRGVFYLPPKGMVGTLAVETVPTGGNPIGPLYAWLARAAVELMEEDKEYATTLTDDEAAKLDPTPFRLVFNQAANFPKIRRMINEADETELVLRKTAISTSGKPSTEKVKLTSKVDTKVERDRATAWARNVYDRFVNKSADTEASLVELEELVDGNVHGVGFNDGYIRVKTAAGTKKIGPNHMDRFFEYHVSPTRPSDTKFVQEVWKEVVDLRVLLGVELDAVE